MKKFFVLLVLVFVLSACINPAEKKDSPVFQTNSVNGEKETLPAALMAVSKSPLSSVSVPQILSKGERLMIRTGSAELEVPQGKLFEGLGKLKALIKSSNGFIEDIGYAETENRKIYHLTVKLPPSSFEGFSFELRSVGLLKSLNTDSGDVTFEYIDLNAKITNLLKQKERVTELFGQAQSLEQTLELEREINRLQTEIDSSTSKKIQMERQITKATLTIDLFEEKPLLDKTVLIPLNQIVNTFTGSLSFGLFALSGLIGLLLPFILLACIIYPIIIVVKEKIRKFKERIK